MATTSRGIVYPTTGNAVTPLATRFADLATSADAAIGTLESSITTKFVNKVNSASERNALFPAPSQGDRVYRADMGYEEAYFALYNVTTNPGGATPAGWYPINGALPYGTAIQSADQSVGSGDVRITLNSAPTLVGGFTFASNALVVPVGGIYEVSAHAYRWSAVGTNRGIQVINAVTNTVLTNGTTASNWTFSTVRQLVNLAAGTQVATRTSGDSSDTLRAQVLPTLVVSYMYPPR